MVTWTGIAAPAGTPAAIVNRINAALKTALKGPLGQQLADAALIPVGDSPEAFRAFLHKDAANYSRLVKSANISLQ
ncbi:Tripartite tricarboxylate transporter family receptor [compost metagenome]